MFDSHSKSKKHIVVLTGSGISAESGLKTFRDSGGLWETYDVMEVASIDGWYKNKELVLRFYNERRKQLEQAAPNKAHLLLKKLEDNFKVSIITQNVDNLHERAGSKNILHLHGELTKVRSTKDPNYIVDIGYKEIKPGDKCPRGGQLRPHIVWFGEAVPAMEEAIGLTQEADIFVIIGTSLNVYPAAGIVDYVKPEVPIFFIDPKPANTHYRQNLEIIAEKASTGMEILLKKLEVS
ncbi:MAG TPA: NAD-dependent deacylase [Bacteroidales bacterium]|nr:NAD-dependent deacylase [Bacteroidales bacterium]